jgi:hypothetical protein
MRTYWFLLISILLFSCEKETKFTVTNPLNVERTDEVIILTKAELAQKVQLKAGLLPVFELKNDRILSSQVDDLDGDGNWDEVVLLVDFAANEFLEIEVDFVPENEYPEFEKRTNFVWALFRMMVLIRKLTSMLHPLRRWFEIISQAEGVIGKTTKLVSGFISIAGI